MPYTVTTPVTFPCDAATVYEALRDLKSYPLWNSGMISVSEVGPLHEGMVYRTKSVATGRQIDALIKVDRLVPNEEIKLVNNSGAVAYEAIFRLSPHGAHETTVTCELKFEFRNFVLDLARPVVESIATTRIRGDLETLRTLITAPAANGVQL